MSDEKESEAMTKYIVRFGVTLDLAVSVSAADDEAAENAALTAAKEYMDTVYGNRRDVIADSSMDDVEAYEIVPAP